MDSLVFAFVKLHVWSANPEDLQFEPYALIETLYRENVSFRDRDLKRQIPCHTASENLDAQLLRNDTSFLSNLLWKSPLINYSPTIFVRLFQPIHWSGVNILPKSRYIIGE